MKGTEHPNVFISYCWTNATHENWVIQLAERLVSDGVNVTIDKWDLKEGQDKYTFMESMVRSADISKVLIILDRKYSEKANNKSGGVGTETQIISPGIYENVSQEKFIPIVTEIGDNGAPFIPTYLQGRIYLDFSANEHFEENYEKLLRNIYKRPALSRPQIGAAPSYLFNNSPTSYDTAFIVRRFERQINQNAGHVNSIVRDFLNKFYRNLKNHAVTFDSRAPLDIGKAICDNILLYTPLRNDLIFFFDKAFQEVATLETDIIIKFLEKLPGLSVPQDDRSTWARYEFDNFRFIGHELFLYLIAVALKNEKYNSSKNFYTPIISFRNPIDRVKQMTSKNSISTSIQLARITTKHIQRTI